ncbi:MAG: hypothetical protein IJR17_05365 [Clostridia bacterium]|nr:hypothetical protein [Clostridia bacterium]
MTFEEVTSLLYLAKMLYPILLRLFLFIQRRKSRPKRETSVSYLGELPWRLLFLASTVPVREWGRWHFALAKMPEGAGSSPSGGGCRR